MAKRSQDVENAAKPERPRHDPPAFMGDFDEGQRAAWDRLLQSFFQEAKTRTLVMAGLQEGKDGFTYQYFDPTTYPDDKLIPQPIVWNAFPKELLVRFGRERAIREADRLWPLAAYHAGTSSDWYDS